MFFPDALTINNLQSMLIEYSDQFSFINSMMDGGPPLANVIKLYCKKLGTFLLIHGISIPNVLLNT